MLRNGGEVRGDDMYAGRAGVAMAFLRTAEVLRRGKLRLEALKDETDVDISAAVRYVSRCPSSEGMQLLHRCYGSAKLIQGRTLVSIGGPAAAPP